VLFIYALLVAPANVLIGPVAATVLISRWFTTKRGTAIGFAISGIAIGTVFFPPILQSLFDHFYWRTAFPLCGLMLLALTLPAALLVIDRPADRGLHPEGATTAAPTAAPAVPQVSVRTILTDPAFWLAASIFTAVAAGTKGMVTNLAPMAIDVGVIPHDAALLVSIYGISAFTAKLCFGIVVARLHTRTLMFLSLTGFTAGMAFLAHAAAGFWMIAAGVSCVGLAGGVMVPMQSYLIPRIFGAHCIGRAYGLMSTVMLVFLLTTPPLFGRIYDLTGSYSAIFLTFIALTIGSMAAVPYIRLHTKQEGQNPPPPALPTAVAGAVES
jgi:MFS family permease